jgi:hypothetical protein
VFGSLHNVIEWEEDDWHRTFFFFLSLFFILVAALCCGIVDEKSAGNFERMQKKNRKMTYTSAHCSVVNGETKPETGAELSRGDLEKRIHT